MVTFHAKQVNCSKESYFTGVTFDEVGEGAEYLLFTRMHEDEEVGDRNVYMERRGQGWAVEGGISRCELHRNHLLLVVKKASATRLGGDSKFEITFELPYDQFRSLKSRMKRVFRGLDCYTDLSAGERFRRQPVNTFLEAIERIFGSTFGPVDQENSSGHDLIRECEEDFEFRIPKILKDYYLRFGENRIFTGGRGVLFTPEMLELEDGHVRFWMGHEDDDNRAYCGIAEGDLNKSDPPIAREIELAEDGSTWVPECRKLSWFILRTMCYQATWGLPHTASTEWNEKIESKIQSNLNLVAPENPLPDEMIAYERDGLYLCILPTKSLIRVGTDTQAKLKRLRKELGGKWS